MPGIEGFALQGLKIVGQLASTQVKKNPALALGGGIFAAVGMLYFTLDAMDSPAPIKEEA